MPMGMCQWTRRPRYTVIVAADGSGDYTDIQGGIDALGTSGGVVYVKDGTYEITETIAIGSNTCLIGNGNSSIISVIGDDLDMNAIENNDPTLSNSHIVIENLRIIDSRSTSTGGSGIKFQLVDTSSIRLCNITDFVSGYSIELNNTFFCNISDNYVDCSVHGIYIYNGSYGLTLINNYSNINITDGIRLIDSDTCLISGCRLSNNGGDGIYGNTTTKNLFSGNIVQSNTSGIYLLGSSDNNSMSGNSCLTNTSVGICIISSSGNAITGNNCNQNNYGIYLDTCIKNTINSNTCNDNIRNGMVLFDDSNYNAVSGNCCMNNSLLADYGNYYSGLLISGTSIYNSIMGNNCSDDQLTATQKYGIEENATTDDYNNIIGNVCRRNASGSILQKGVHSIVYGNIESD